VKKIIFITSFFSLILLINGSSFVQSDSYELIAADSTKLKSDINYFLNQNDPWVEKILSEMSLEEKAGQVVFPHAFGKYMSEDNPDYERLVFLVKDLKVGGIIFFLSNIYDQAIVTNKLQKIANVPLLISADFERGVAQRAAEATIFPYNMGIGAADDTDLTYQMGEIIAIEGTAIGVHQNYAPVSDINNNPFNPIINVRSFGEDADHVKRLSNSFLRGVQDGGMIATSKHFPGHGNTNVDSHRELPVILGTEDELLKNELAPFRSNIENGVMSIMVGHLQVPAFEPDNKLPSTLSKKIITDLLKDKLGFKGLIVTDAMEMHAITNSFASGEAAILALQAGNDAILFPADPEAVIKAIISAVKKGDLTEERLNQSVRKILLAKKWAGLDKSKLIDIESISQKVGVESHWEIARKLARKSITLVKDDQTLIPLSQNKNIKYLHVSILDSKFGGEENYFNSILKSRLNNLSIERISLNSNDSDYEDALTSAKNSDFILLSSYLKVRAFEGDLGLTKLQTELVHNLLGLGKPLVFMAHGSPYILSRFPKAETYICNYGDTEVSESALAEAIFGEISIQGKLPISIPDTDYKYGWGFQKPKTALHNISRLFQKLEQNKFVEADSLIKKAIVDSAFPGAVLLVAKDGEIIHERAFGNFTYDYSSREVTTNAIFDLASVSKVIGTTTAAMMLVDRGKLKLDEKVISYLPEFNNNGKENITIRNLLLHNSGLAAFKKYYDVYSTAEEVINDIMNLTPEQETGSKYVYSDLGMITLQQVIERISGQTLDNFLEENLFIPLSMNSTMYNPPPELKNNCMPTEFDDFWRMRQLQGEVHDERAYMLNGVAGHAGLFSTANDLAKFLQMILQKGSYQGRQYISPETIELFTKKQSEQSSRGLGWDTKSPEGSSAGKYFDLSSYGHTGYTGTSVWSDPTKNLIVVLLTNRVYPTRNNNKLSKVRPLIHDAIYKAVVQE
jgi:beta-glucosidase-like glycosyl hydrolase/CubicO group peptidase (beta-lactamase class C family)